MKYKRYIVFSAFFLISLGFVVSALAGFERHPCDVFNDMYGTAGTRIDATADTGCLICHFVESNPYGSDLYDYLHECFETSICDEATIEGAIRNVESLDSDSDGYSNIIEINNLTFPNDPNDYPVYASYWAKAYGGNGWDSAFSVHSVRQTADGGFIVAGETDSFGAGSIDFLVLKLDTNGNISWQKTYGASGYDYAESIQQTVDGGYVVVGWTNSFGAGNYDFLVLKLDANGNISWQKTYGGTLGDGAESIQQTSDGGYIVLGETDSFGAENGDFWVLKLDANGNVQWQKTYGGGLFDRARSIQQTSDSGYIMGGMTESFGAGSGDAWILKLDSNGNVQWQKTYGGSNFDGAAIQQTSDGGYIMAGRTASFGAGSDDVWVLKLDTNGNVQWQKTYGGSGSEITPSIQQTSDGGYIVGGVTNFFGSGNDDIWVLKLDSNGDIPGCSIIGTSNAIVNNTSATIGITTIAGINTSVSPETSTASVINTSLSITDICDFGNMLLSPNGAEVVPSGSTYSIQWVAPPEAARFDIGYSLDNGAVGTWKLIASNLTSYSYNWTVPALDRNNNTCRVGVRGYNASGGVVGTDISDNPFNIEVVKLTYPNGGETLISGNTYQITWQTNGTIRPVQSVQIYGSPNEGQLGTWRLLTTITGNSGYYDWTVPIVGTTKDKCRLGLRLLDSASIPIGQDVGDGNFTIQPAP